MATRSVPRSPTSRTSPRSAASATAATSTNRVAPSSTPSTRAHSTKPAWRATASCSERSPSRSAAQTAQLCKAEGAPETTVIEADVRDADACERLVADTMQALGGIDGVVVNVGIGAGGNLAHTSPEQWDDVFAVNARAHFLVARA